MKTKTVYRAHEVTTDEVMQNDSLPTLVEYVASRSNTFPSYRWYAVDVDATNNEDLTGGAPITPNTELHTVIKALYNSYKVNGDLKDRIRSITPGPDYFSSAVTMVVRVGVDGLNMINQPYDPEHLLRLALTKDDYNTVFIENITVDREEAIDMFGDEENLEYSYEGLELTSQEREVLGILDDEEDLELDFSDEDILIDLDQFTASNPPVSSGGILTPPPGKVGTTRPKALKPKQL